MNPMQQFNPAAASTCNATYQLVRRRCGRWTTLAICVLVILECYQAILLRGIRDRVAELRASEDEVRQRLAETIKAHNALALRYDEVLEAMEGAFTMIEDLARLTRQQ